MTFIPPILCPQRYGMDPLSLQITFGWCGFYGTLHWDKLNKMCRLGLGLCSVRVMWMPPSFSVFTGFNIPPEGRES